MLNYETFTSVADAMLFCHTLPLFDARPFLSHRGLKLDHPDWPDPDLDQYVRGFGAIRKHSAGASGLPYGHRVCDAHRMLRYPTRHPALFIPGSGPFPLLGKFRRFYSDGQSVGILETGLTEAIPGRGVPPLERLATGFWMLPVRVFRPGLAGQPESSRDHLLYQAGPEIARAYLLASTRSPLPGFDRMFSSPPDPDWVSAGAPVVVIEAGEARPTHAELVSERPLRIYRDRFRPKESPGVDFDTWLIVRKPEETQTARKLRTLLAQRHVTVESVRRLCALCRQDGLYGHPGTKQAEEIRLMLMGLKRGMDNFINDCGQISPAPLPPLDAAEAGALLQTLDNTLKRLEVKRSAIGKYWKSFSIGLGLPGFGVTVEFGRE